MATFKTEEAFNAACEKLRNAVEEAQDCYNAVHIGFSNAKTGASVNEGTTPIVTCCAHACKTCARSCYAVLHIDNIYPAARRNHAENTIMRRRNAKSYYEAFFSEALRRGMMLRINETGDFENARQVAALKAVARRFPSVPVIGYTRRTNLVDAIADLCKACPNVSIRYSCFTDAPSKRDEHARETVKTCRVDPVKTTCLAQLHAANGETWTCAACAAAKVGCFDKCACITFKMH